MKKSKTKPISNLPPLLPEAEAALQSQVAVVAAACDAGRDLKSLKSLVTINPQDPLWDLHLMALLADVGHPAVPMLLAALFGEATDKARRKGLKRALHLLQTRGVPVPGELLPREEPVIGQTKPVEVKALVSPILGNGDSVVVLEAPKEILGGNFLVAVINDEKGLLECHLLVLKSRQQTEFWEYYRRQGLADWFPVPGPYAVRLLEAAYRGREVATEATRRYASVREQIWKNWGRPEEAPDLEQLLPALEPGERSRLLEQSRQLAGSPLFHSWLPGLEEITPWLDKVREVEQSPLVLSDQQKAVRADALLAEATRALFPMETRPLWGRRLLTMAYYLELSQRPEEARVARVVAADLRHPEPTALGGENPFLQGLVKTTLALAWQESQKPREAREPGGLLTLPGDSPLIRS
ncbi:MAG: hypothetical protein ACHQ2F_01845 [Desulfobaccales bacterium]